MPEDAPPPEPPAPRTAPTLAAIVALAFAARLAFSLLKLTVATDAFWYVRISKMMLAGDWHHAIDQGYHPAYPALSALLSLVLRDVPTAATAVSILLGALTAIPAWFIGHRLGGPRAALFAALLVAVHPECVDEGSDILVEATFVFFFLSGTACALRAIATLDLRAAALSGLCGGLAYLTRPEGLALPAFTAVALAVAGLQRFRSTPSARWARRAAAAALATGVFLACFLPYAIVLHNHLGRWTITGKSGGEAFTKGHQAEKGTSQVEVATKSDRNPLYLPFYFVRKSFITLYPGFLPILIAALLLRAQRTADQRLARLALLGLLAIYLPPLLRLLYAKSYLSTRHLLTPVLIILLLSAPAAAALSLRWKRGLAILVLFIVAVALPKSLRPARRDQLPLKDAGHWLRAVAPGAEFMGPEKTAFYAVVFFYKVPKSGKPDDIVESMRRERLDWLVLLESDQPGVAARLDGRFQLVQEFGAGEDRVGVYRLSP